MSRFSMQFGGRFPAVLGWIPVDPRSGLRTPDESTRIADLSCGSTCWFDVAVAAEVEKRLGGFTACCGD
ncbi:unnamed protein product [Arabidopsis halleri]